MSNTSNLNLSVGELYEIKYTNNKQEQSTRTIVPTKVPFANIKAIDVTQEETPVQENIAELVKQYNEYLTAHMQQAFSFQDWVEHTTGSNIDPTWRTFKPEKIEL